MKVVKFGGSSLADAGQIQKAAAIIKAEADRRYVVPSAPGKRFKDDIKVTDMLYQCYALAEKGEAFATQLAAIKDRYVSILNGLSMPKPCWMKNLSPSAKTSGSGSAATMQPAGANT